MSLHSGTGYRHGVTLSALWNPAAPHKFTPEDTKDIHDHSCHCNLWGEQICCCNIRISLFGVTVVRFLHANGIAFLDNRMRSVQPCSLPVRHQLQHFRQTCAHLAPLASAAYPVPLTSRTPYWSFAGGRSSTLCSPSIPAASALLMPLAPGSKNSLSAVTKSSPSGATHFELFNGDTCMIYIVSISSRLRPWCSHRKK